MRCKSCEKWYGAEDDDYGPCSIKHARGDKKFITHGEHVCDEIYRKQELDGGEKKSEDEDCGER